MKKNILLYPQFLQKFDGYLVKKYPVIWSVRAHYFLYYSILSCVVLGALAMLTPVGMDDLDYSTNGTAISISTILSITITCFWVYKTVIFDKQRQFGNRKFTDEYISFFLSFVTLLGFWAIIFSYAGILQFKRSHIVSDKELIEDVNTANLAQVFMITTNSPYSSEVRDDHPLETLHHANSFMLNWDFNYFTNYNLYDNNNDYASRRYDRTSDHEVILAEGLWSNSEVNMQANKIKTKAQVYEQLEKIWKLSKKYDIYENRERFSEGYDASPLNLEDLKKQYDDAKSDMEKLDAQNKTTGEGASPQTYQNASVYFFKTCLNDRFTDIAGYKFGRRGLFNNEFLLVSFYFILGICILLHIFKNVRWKQFVIFLVTCGLLPIIYTIFGIMIAPRGDNAEAYAKLCYYATFFYGVVHLIIAFDKKEYSLWNIIGVMIFNAMILTLPLFTFLFLEAKNMERHDLDEMLYIIQWIETSFYLIAVLPFMKRVYEKIYALPRA